jgi:hypothetical protein
MGVLQQSRLPAPEAVAVRTVCHSVGCRSFKRRAPAQSEPPAAKIRSDREIKADNHNRCDKNLHPERCVVGKNDRNHLATYVPHSDDRSRSLDALIAEDEAAHFHHDFDLDMGLAT